jgi:two-component system, cell cycle response regulator DivK
MAGESILIVDDDANNLKIIAALLRHERYSVQQAASAEDALELLQTCAPRLILMDIELPGMNGLELTRELKNDPVRRRIIVLAFTGSAMPGIERKTVEAGCDGCILKPVSAEVLLETIAAFTAANHC